MKTYLATAKPSLIARALVCIAAALAIIACSFAVALGGTIITSVNYMDSDGSSQKHDALSITSGDTSWGTSGNETWYVANEDVTVSSSVTVNGNVRLILKQDTTLTLTGGFNVTSGSSLIIYRQFYGPGMLVIAGKCTIEGSSSTESGSTVSAAKLVNYAPVTINENVTFENGGIFINNGTITNNGSITNSGIIVDYGTSNITNADNGIKVTKPQKVDNLVYDRTGQALITAATTTTGTVQYKVGASEQTWSTDIPYP